MNYSKEDEDIFPNPNIVIEYGRKLDEETGKEDFFKSQTYKDNF